MWTYRYNKVEVGKPWVDVKGFTQSANWDEWSCEMKAFAGLRWEEDPVTEEFDSRFYDSNHAPLPLDDIREFDEKGEKFFQEGLKIFYIRRVKYNAYNRLRETDPYYIRFMETGKEVPQVVKDFRAGVRDCCAIIEDKINATQTIEEFIELFQPTLDENGNRIEHAPINQWPP